MTEAQNLFDVGVSSEPTSPTTNGSVPEAVTKTSLETNPETNGHVIENEQPVAADSSASDSLPESEVTVKDLETMSLEQLEALANDPKTSSFLRKPIEAAISLAKAAETEKQKLSEEVKSFREKFGDYSSLSKEDLDRITGLEEKVYNLASLGTNPEQFVETLSEFVPSQKLEEIKSHLAWSFLENPDESPNLENIQIIVDRFSGQPGAVSAKDVIEAINALRDGIISRDDLVKFNSMEEYEEYQRRKTLEEQLKEREKFIEENVRFQEEQTRQMLLSSVINEVQSNFQPQVNNILNKFNLLPVSGEPEFSANVKNEIREKLAAEINRFAKEDRHLSDVLRSLDLLSKPTGTPIKDIQNEIESYVNSFAYKTALNKGMSALMANLEKVAAREAYKYKLMMDGYKAQQEKKNNAPSANMLTQNTGAYDKIQNSDRNISVHDKLRNISNILRGQTADVPRYGS